MTDNEYNMASKLIERDIAWLHEESDPTVFNAWLEIVLLEGFKGYANFTEQELADELARREAPDDDEVDDEGDKDKELKENPYIFNPTTGAVTFVSPRSLELAEFCQSLASLDNDDGDLKLLD